MSAIIVLGGVGSVPKNGWLQFMMQKGNTFPCLISKNSGVLCLQRDL